MRSSHQVIAKLAYLALLLTGMGCTTILGDDFRVDSDGGDGDGLPKPVPSSSSPTAKHSVR